MPDPISILSAVDLCFKYGAKLLKLCSAFAHAESELKDRLLQVKVCWMQAELQLKVVKIIAPGLHEDQREILYEMLEALASKVKVANELLESMTKSHGFDSAEVHVRRWKYALFHQKIGQTVEDLEKWQQRFNPIWYLTMTPANSLVDASLDSYRAPSVGLRDPISSAQALRSARNSDTKEKVRLPEEVLDSLKLQQIPFCSAYLAKRPDAEKLLIVERIEPVPGSNMGDLERDIRDLAKRLIRADPLEFGLLCCKGFMKHREKTSVPSESAAFTVLFRVPDDISQPRTLRSCLLEMTHTDSLSDRFKLASELARAVSYVHTFGFVHKNIRPETILLLGSDETSLGPAVLIGFDSFRMASGKTLRRGQAAWDKCLYQHPDRMGPTPSEDYIMQHDIYSLGVCLLELGLWETFAVHDTSQKALVDDDHGRQQPTPAPILGAAYRSFPVKDRLLSLARRELRAKMGTQYSEVVLTCLTCLDAGNVDFGDAREFQDEDGIEVGVRYIKKVRAGCLSRSLAVGY
ncbi:uncharacterized protein N7459_006299 [Penicillium hispanicum]|uniref:uncharacterized protein n=1 Tax=Penicillium hispanicum TaxID=1080232 RepID=UPI00253FB2CB|nr:uncharacterized protein N7459_006299 [Penicillium hispanicum]KAJ5580314.1 hypothetical protein N7459_006299 [Penicillium hispanicum]